MIRRDWEKDLARLVLPVQPGIVSGLKFEQSGSLTERLLANSLGGQIFAGLLLVLWLLMMIDGIGFLWRRRTFVSRWLDQVYAAAGVCLIVTAIISAVTLHSIVLPLGYAYCAVALFYASTGISQNAGLRHDFSQSH